MAWRTERVISTNDGDVKPTAVRLGRVWRPTSPQARGRSLPVTGPRARKIREDHDFPARAGGAAPSHAAARSRPVEIFGRLEDVRVRRCSGLGARRLPRLADRRTAISLHAGTRVDDHGARRSGVPTSHACRRDENRTRERGDDDPDDCQAQRQQQQIRRHPQGRTAAVRDGCTNRRLGNRTRSARWTRSR